MAELIEFEATDADGSAVFVDPDEVEDIKADDLGLGTFIVMKSGIINHVDCDPIAAASCINAAKTKAKEGAD